MAATSGSNGSAAADPAGLNHVSLPNAGLAQFTLDDELATYREMLLIRRFEEKAGQMYGMGLIGGFCHLYIGQEAVIVGMTGAIKPGDQTSPAIATTPICSPAACPPKAVMAELTGRAQRHFQGQRRLDAHVLGRTSFLRRTWHRRRAGAAGHRPRLRQSISMATTMSASPILATAPPTRARSTRASTWQSSGSCLSSM